MKNHTLLHDSFAIKSGSKTSKVKTLNLRGTRQVAGVPVQLKNGDKVFGYLCLFGQWQLPKLVAEVNCNKSELKHEYHWQNAN